MHATRTFYSCWGGTCDRHKIEIQIGDRRYHDGLIETDD